MNTKPNIVDAYIKKHIVILYAYIDKLLAYLCEQSETLLILFIPANMITILNPLAN